MTKACSRLRRQPIQLELLLESGGLVAAFASDVACTRLDDGKHQGRDCFRVEVPSPGGAFLFWVDQADHRVRVRDEVAVRGKIEELGQVVEAVPFGVEGSDLALANVSGSDVIGIPFVDFVFRF